MANSQSIAVVLVLLIASAYVVRRAWLRVRSVLRPKTMNASSCATACGSCGPSIR